MLLAHAFRVLSGAATHHRICQINTTLTQSTCRRHIVSVVRDLIDSKNLCIGQYVTFFEEYCLLPILYLSHTDCTRKQKLQKMHIDFSKRAKCKKCTQKVLIIKHTKTAKKKAHTKHKKCTQEMQKTHQKCQNDIPVRAKMIYRF